MKHKRRGRGEGRIGQRPDGLWYGRVDVGYGNGKRRRKAVYGQTRGEVVGKLTQVLHDKQSGLPITTGRQTVGQYLRYWLEHVARPRVRPRTFETYRLAIEQHLLPGLGTAPLRSLTPQRLQTWLNDHHADGASARTCQYARSVLRAALTQALRWNLIARNVATLVDVPRTTKREIQPFDPQQARDFLSACSGHRLEALFAAAVALGLRVGEVLGLHWTDIDLERATLRVRQALQRYGGDPVARKTLRTERKRLLRALADAKPAGDTKERDAVRARLTDVRAELRRVATTLHFVEPKTQRSRREIAVPDVVLRAVRRHRVRQLEERLQAGAAWQEQNLVFSTPIGTPLDARNVSREFHALLASAGLPSIRFHDLRHTAATLLLAQGVNPRTVMETLGHSQISLTLDTYSHILPALKKDAADKMDAVLKHD